MKDNNRRKNTINPKIRRDIYKKLFPNSGSDYLHNNENGRQNDSAQNQAVDTVEDSANYFAGKINKYGNQLIHNKRSSSVEVNKKAFIRKRKVELSQKNAQKTAKTTKRLEKIISDAAHTVKKAASGLSLLLAAGGSIPLVILILICSVGLAVSSVFGIFFASEDTGAKKSMQTVVQEINEEYREKINQIKTDNPHDSVRVEGSSSAWRDVLSVYAVIINTDPNNPQEVVTLNQAKIDILHDLFWEMNIISYNTETVTETVETEISDEDGNYTETITEEKEITLLRISIRHRTAYEMAGDYDFDGDQMLSLQQLLDKKNDSMWAAVLYGIHAGDTAIIEVARSQIGNEGGEPYWSWYGFNEHVNWCACFVSWCANECGYIEDGVIPKHDYCPNGVQWFRDHGQWAEGNEEPSPGMLIYFDYDNRGDYGDQDGKPDHVGIVEKAEDGWIYTIEGNSPDVVAEHKYIVGFYEILGYGIPKY